MLTIRESRLPAGDEIAEALRSFAWSGASILDARAIQADDGHLLFLTADGTLHRANLSEGTSVASCSVDLPELPSGDSNGYFGTPRYRLHASIDGSYAAIVVDHGRYGTVVDARTGSVTMRLDGGDYHENTVPFSACFLRFEGDDVLVHRTAWNRLDAADPATGKSLTDRYIASYEKGVKRAHDLDYFHGRLRPSPNGRRIFDDGWVWHPVSVPRVWSVTDWLGANPWESEDGASVVDLTSRDDWTTPACWIDERHVALWGLADWDIDEGEESGQGSGVRLFDVTESKQSSTRRWPMDLHAHKIFDLFSDGTRLFVAADTGTAVWDVASRVQITVLPGFTADLIDLTRNTLVSFGPDEIAELQLSPP